MKITPLYIIAITFFLSQVSGLAQGSIQHDDFVIGEQLYATGRYDSSIAFYEKAKLYFQQEDDTLSVIKIDHMLGRSMYNCGRCEEAVNILRDATDRSIMLYPDNDRLISEGYHHLSRATGGCLSDHTKALQLMDKSNEINKELYGEMSSKMAKNYNFVSYFHSSMGNFDSADVYLKRALQIWSLNQIQDSLEYARTLSRRIQVFVAKGQYDSALQYATTSLAIREQFLVPDHPTVSNSLTNVGRAYSLMDDLDQALVYYLRGLEMRKSILGEEHANVGSSYLSIGNLYGSLFNYERAIHFISQGCNILEKRFGDGLPVLHTYYSYLGTMHSRLKQFDEAAKLFKRAERLAEGYERSEHPFKAFIFNGISDFYSELGDLENQIRYLNYFLEINQKVYGSGTLNEADALVKLGEAYVKGDRLEKGGQLFAQAAKIYDDHVDSNSTALTVYYSVTGDLFLKKGEYFKATSQYRRSLSTLYGDELPEAETIDINRFSHKYRAFRAAVKAAQATYDASKSEIGEQPLLTSLEYIDLAYALLEELASAYRMEVSRSQLEREGRNFFSLSIAVLHQLYIKTGEGQYADLAFSFSERSKSPILKSRLNDSRAMMAGKVPMEMLEKERELRANLSYYKAKLRKAKLTNDSTALSNYQDMVFGIQQSFESFKKDLQGSNEGYYDYYYENEQISKSEVQENLDEDEVLIEYFEGKHIFRFTISQSEFIFERLAESDKIGELFREYSRSLSDSKLIIENPKKADSLFCSTGHELFTHLVKSPVSSWKKKVDKLIIVPDGFISQVNFSTLLQDSVASSDYKRLPYLMRDYSISYAYSALPNSIRSSGNTTVNFGGFAPSYSVEGFNNMDTALHPMVYALVRNGNLPLPGAIDEVKLIGENLGGDTWLNDQASETNFKSHSGDYNIIHLAMHSLLNEQDPEYSELLFSSNADSTNDGFLTINEIYNLEMNADLVVLSACSSGSGKLDSGEGPISFSRAFSYAGSPSVVMSLWKVPDVATSQIMISFYNNLMEGMEKGVALKEAQLEFLDTQEDPILRHPFYWAGFVTLGDTKPISTQNRSLYLLIGSLIFVVTLSFFAFRKRTTNQ